MPLVAVVPVALRRLLLILAPLVLAATAAGAAPVSVHGRIEAEPQGRLGEGQPGDGKLVDGIVRLYPLVGVREAGELQRAGAFPPPPKAEAKVGADGGFRLEAPGAGVWRLVASARGRAPMETVLQPLVEETWLPAAGLPADAPLAVTVVDAAGKPVAGAAVVAEPVDGRFLADWTPAPARLVTDAAGKAVVHRAAATRMDLTVAAAGHAVAQVKGAGGSSVRVALAAGAARELLVSGPDGRPAPGALVMALPSYAPLAASDAAGKVSLAAAGSAPLSLLVEDRAGAGARVTVEPPAKGEPALALRVALERPVSLSGRVIDAETRQPLAGAVVFARERLEGWVLSDGRGVFTLERLPAKGGGSLRAEAASHLGAAMRRTGGLAAAGRAPTLALYPAAALVGSVTDVKGRPVAGAEVAAFPAPSQAGAMRSMRRMAMAGGSGRAARTDERGRYRLAPLATGTPYNVSFQRAGFAGLTKLLPPAPRDRVAELHVTLLAGARGVGRVVTMQGAAIEGAKVSLDRQGERAPAMRMVLPGTQRALAGPEAVSDAAGSFAVADLAPGRFVLRVEAAGFAATNVPGIEVPAHAGEIDLGTVKLGAGAVVEGRVVGSAGEPLEGAEVFVLDGMAGMMPQVRWALADRAADANSAADGFFRIADRAPGEKMDLAVRRGGYTVERLLGVVAPTAEPVTVTLRPSSTVRGRVVDQEGEPVAEAMVRLTVERAGGGFAFQTTAGAISSGDDGRFTIEDVDPGTVRLTINAAGYLPLERGGVEVVAGKDLEGLELVVHAGATVEGRVTGPDGAPAIGASVSVVAEGQTGGPMRMMVGYSAQTDGDGQYRLEGVETGPRTLEAEHEDFDRGVAALEVRPGENQLDLRLGGGQEVSGRVVSSSGEPVASAAVSLGTAGQPFWTERGATSDEAGQFTVTGVRDGTYQAAATHRDYGDGRAGAPVTVAGAPVGGITIELPAGAAVVGALRGLSLAELGRTQVMAFQDDRGWKQGTVSYDGRYRVAGLAPGEWTVSARLAEGGRQARGRVTLPAGASEETLDLDFEGGLAISGHVRQDGRAAAGVIVMARGDDVVGGGTARTDYAGAYRLENLHPGKYRLEVFSTQSGMRRNETVVLDADRELDFDLRSTRIAGKVVEAGTGEPLAGVTVRVERARQGGDELLPFGGAATSDDGGRFVLGTAAEGSWLVSAQKAGYARAEVAVEVSEDPVEDLEIRLSPTQGITLQVSRLAGAPPAQVQVAVLDGRGYAVIAGSYPTGENGRVRLSTVPPGSWEVLVRADDSSTVRLVASSPGQPVPVVLAPQATLAVSVAALAGEPAVATVTLTGSDGTPFAFPGWGTVERRFNLSYGRTTIPFLPAGTWTVQATASDGRRWAGTAVTAPGGASTVELE